ncbi:MAG: imelysin family protein [Verrucomicrobiales bacterium]|nr:imelysin family protein [Verrucomicrobiales bacterium]
MTRGIVSNYAKIVYASYLDSLTLARELEKALHAFVKDPTAAGQEECKKIWLEARRPYLQTEAYRFYAGPIDDKDGPESMINGWPMDESYIDSVDGAPESGIIHQTELYPEISKELIASLNEKAGETAITSGFHAIEFLLWGQDQSDDGPGDRPFSDYIDAPNAKRRSAYLVACGELLGDHLESLVKEWAPDQPGNYRAGFEAKDPVLATREILYGLHVMSGKELAGERMLVAWDTQDREDEHSCFSDTTHFDHQRDAMGIENVYRGRYRKQNGEMISGSGIRALVRVFQPDRLAEFDRKMVEVTKSIAAIPSPFESAVLGGEDAPGRVAILHAVEHLEDFAAMMAEVDQWLLSRR